jgi:hypothetical protein
MKPKSTTTHRLIVSDPHGLCTPSQLVAIQAIESSIAGLNQLCQPLAIDDRLRIDREQLVADSSEFGRAAGWKIGTLGVTLSKPVRERTGTIRTAFTAFKTFIESRSDDQLQTLYRCCPSVYIDEAAPRAGHRLGSEHLGAHRIGVDRSFRSLRIEAQFPKIRRASSRPPPASVVSKASIASVLIQPWLRLHDLIQTLSKLRSAPLLIADDPRQHLQGVGWELAT